MYRKTTQSSFIAGATVNRGFFVTEIWTPFCQLWNFHGPLETGIEFSKSLFPSWPWTTCAGKMPDELPAMSVSQSAYTFLKTTVPFLPWQFTDLTSSQPVRLTTLLAGLMKSCHPPTRQSLQVTGRPSLHTAFG